jgi:hypothetical protein
MMLSPRLLNAYRRTRYAAGPAEVRIGRRSPSMDRILAGHRARIGVFVTAWNPFSRRMPAGWNKRMQARLRERLRRCVMLAAEGVWRSWREDHFVVLTAPAFVLRLARQFRQAAVVIVRRGQPAALTTSFPVFSPRKSMPSARGACSSPSRM